MSEEGRPRASRAEWVKRVERWQESGLSAEQFASELGIRARTLTYWKWLLGKEARGPASVRATRKRKPPAEGATASFIEVRADAGDGRFALELRGGRRIHVPASFDADALRRLVAVLEAE
jgi:transposase